MNDYKNILVAVDGSKEAENAFRKSIEIAKLNHGSMLHIAYVINSYLILENDFPAFEREKQLSENLLNRYQSIALDEGITNIEVLIKHGSPKKLIAEELASLVNADLIVCGVTSIKDAEHFFLGSVSQYVVQTAACDVMIARTD
ncbi:universal stress protein [Sporosarcina sp. 6E9]|uniref:universal stress protein n=1 Tax=Sporosarcina sp. 6E9 TaxID=2819235 RepID=UPI001B305C31|nr:universal stress protein [Sporosarcina sp. 6E9]